MPAERRTRWTAAAVRELMERSPEHGPRYELIDGELLVTPAPRMEHQRALEWLRARLSDYIGRAAVGELLAAPADLELVEESLVQPDLFVLPPDESRRARHWADVKRLILAVEILSPSTARHDRGVKRELYQRARIDEYWIVDLEARLVERWRPDDERPEISRARLAWHPAGAAAPLVLELEALFAAAWREE